MPRKRTHGKRRLDAHSGAEAWKDLFALGHSIFDDFTLDTGVETDRVGRVPVEAAEEAWRAYGAVYLALNGRETAKGDAPWALTQFGEPIHAR